MWVRHENSEPVTSFSFPVSVTSFVAPTLSGDRLTFSLSDAQLQSGYYTLAFSAQGTVIVVK